MDSRELRTFVQVAQKANFTKAADDLGYAQSSVTAQVRKLEKELGVQLFDRLSNGIRMTPQAERLLPYARQILDLMEQASNQLRWSDALSGTLIVGTMESIASFRLLPLVEYMHLRHPQLRLSMRPSLCDQTIDSIQRGEFDCGFFMDTRKDFTGVTVEALTEEELVLAAEPNHSLASVTDIDLDDLRAQRFLGTEPGCAYRNSIEKLLTGDDAEPFPILEFGTIDSIKRGVASGLGVALLPKVACLSELARGDLVALSWHAPFSVRTYVAWRKDSGSNPLVAALVDAAHQIVAEQQTELVG